MSYRIYGQLQDNRYTKAWLPVGLPQQTEDAAQAIVKTFNERGTGSVKYIYREEVADMPTSTRRRRKDKR